MINTDCVEIYCDIQLWWKVTDEVYFVARGQVQNQVRNEVCWQMEWEARMKVWRKVFE
jgi:hypothetical protein